MTGENSPAADERHIRAALGILVASGNVVELRALGGEKGGTVSGYYDNLDKLADNAARLSRHAFRVAGIYLTLNPVNPDLLARAANRLESYAKHTTRDSDVLLRRWFLIDVDPIRPAGISATDEEHQAALTRVLAIAAYLSTLGFPEAVVADSGNGAHLLYRIDLPNDAPTTALLQRCLEALDFIFSDTAVAVDRTTYNASRIARLYGTLARKGDATAERPHRVSRIIQAPTKIDAVGVELLEQLATKLPAPSKSRSNARKRDAEFDVDKWVTEQNVPVVGTGEWKGGRKWILNPCPFDSAHDNRSAVLLQLPSGAVAFRCHHNGCAGKSWRDLREIYEPGLAGTPSPDAKANRRDSRRPSGDLHSVVREIILDQESEGFDKRRQVFDVVRKALLDAGYLCRTQDDRAFYFSKKDRRLYDLEQGAFAHLLTEVSGLSSTEGEFRFVLAMLRAEAARMAPVEVHTLAHFDQGSGRLAISDGGPGVWVHELHGPWKLTDNGQDGLLFFTEPDALPFTPDLDAPADAFDWFLRQIPFAIRDALSAEDQRTMYAVAFLQLFFPVWRRTCVVPAFLGPQGSGKTTAMRLTGRLLVGPNFDVTSLREDKEDAFVAAVTNRTVHGVDNADSRVKWFEDALATYATRQRYRLRKLYTTNDEVSYSPRAFVMLSSRDPHFRRPDVAERVLPFHFEKLAGYRDENAIFGALERRRSQIWGAILNRLADLADVLPHIEAPAVPFRMADYAVFGWRIFSVEGKEGGWLALLERVEAAQAEFAGEGDSVIETLRTMLDRDGKVIGPVEIKDLFKRCTEIASEHNLPMPKTVQGFGQKITNMRRVIELELSARITEERLHARKRMITIARRSSASEEAP